MSTLLIENLPRVLELDRAARAAIRGGVAYMPASIAVGEPDPNGHLPGPSLPSMPPLPSLPPMPPMLKLPEFPPGFPFQPKPPHIVPL